MPIRVSVFIFNGIIFGLLTGSQYAISAGHNFDLHVEHRLQTAGAARPCFDTQALQSLFELSSGIPRRINRLCDMALLVGYVDQLNLVTQNEIEAVADELMTTTSAA